MIPENIREKWELVNQDRKMKSINLPSLHVFHFSLISNSDHFSRIFSSSAAFCTRKSDPLLCSLRCFEFEKQA